MSETDFRKTGGILNQKTFEQHMRLGRYVPSPDIGFFVERYWIIHWDFTGQPPFTQETLEHPCVNLVFEKNLTRIYGITRGRSPKTLEGKGQVFGIKFRPGAFYPFVHFPMANLTDTSMSFCDVFGIDSAPLDEVLLTTDDAQAAIACAEEFLRDRLPPQDDNITLVNQVVDCIVDNPMITRVEDVVKKVHLSKRTLQRLFQRYVGVSPRWVIQRYRLHEAVDRLEKGQTVDFARLAVSLGYFDQAHFIRGFKKIVGKTPGEYARRVDESDD